MGTGLLRRFSEGGRARRLPAKSVTTPIGGRRGRGAPETVEDRLDRIVLPDASMTTFLGVCQRPARSGGPTPACSNPFDEASSRSRHRRGSSRRTGPPHPKADGGLCRIGVHGRRRRLRARGSGVSATRLLGPRAHPDRRVRNGAGVVSPEPSADTPDRDDGSRRTGRPVRQPDPSRRTVVGRRESHLDHPRPDRGGALPGRTSRAAGPCRRGGGRRGGRGHRSIHPVRAARTIARQGSCWRPSI